MRTNPTRGQTLLLMALTMLAIVAMACMTLAISSRIRQKLELQTVADTAAYSQAVATARTFNSVGILNRTIVSHWVAMLGIQANVAWGSTVTAYFDGYARKFQSMIDYGGQCGNPNASPCGQNCQEERQRLRELRAARDAFLHASFAMWKPPGGSSDNVSVPFCSASKCFPRVDSGNLERRVIREARDVRQSIGDLVLVQNDMFWSLTDALFNQTLANQVATTANGAYQVQAGPNGAPIAARETQGALGVGRSDILPLAHAAMGARGNRFVMSSRRPAPDGRGGHFASITPLRASKYVERIENALNRRFGQKWVCANGSCRFRDKFEFSVANGLGTTYFNNGGARQNYEDDGFDEAIAEVTDGEVDDDPSLPPDDDVTPPKFYDASNRHRITPSSSLGYSYVESNHYGSLKWVHRGPCYNKRGKGKMLSFSRGHAIMPDPLPSHEWHFAYKLVRDEEENDDGAPEHTPIGERVLHGTASGNGHGFEIDDHRPGFRPCGPGHRHQHWAELRDDAHNLGAEINDMGVAPGGFGFVFPGAAVNCDSSLSASQCQAGASFSGAAGAFGQPKTPVLITRPTSGPSVAPDPWDLTVNFRFSPSGPGTRLDLAKATGATQHSAAISTGMAYYHRRCDSYERRDWNSRQPPNQRSECISWNEAPNLLNPFWRATLVPIDVDESLPNQGDKTPGGRIRNDAPKMLRASGLDDAARTYNLLNSAGFEGIQ